MSEIEAEANKKKKPAPRGHLRGKVLNYFMKRPDQPVHLEELAKELKESNHKRVQTAVNNLRASADGVKIATVVRGQIWKFEPDAEPQVENRLFEKIGQAKDGSLILEGEDGKLYKATEL